MNKIYVPDCCDCNRKYEKEKNKEYRANKEKNIINAVLKDIYEEMRQEHEVYFAREDFDTAYGLDLAMDIVKKRINKKENTDGK